MDLSCYSLKKLLAPQSRCSLGKNKIRLLPSTSKERLSPPPIKWGWQRKNEQGKKQQESCLDSGSAETKKIISSSLLSSSPTVKSKKFKIKTQNSQEPKEQSISPKYFYSFMGNTKNTKYEWIIWAVKVFRMSRSTRVASLSFLSEIFRKASLILRQDCRRFNLFTYFVIFLWLLFEPSNFFKIACLLFQIYFPHTGNSDI